MCCLCHSHQKQRKAEEIEDGEKKEMVTPQLRAALQKQGYRIVGSHSGVKLCRWTKVNIHSINITLYSTFNPLTADQPGAYLAITKCIPDNYKVHTWQLQSAYLTVTKCIPGNYKVYNWQLQSAYLAMTKCIPGNDKVHTWQLQSVYLEQ